jgi:hypothetical protein
LILLQHVSKGETPVLSPLGYPSGPGRICLFTPPAKGAKYWSLFKGIAIGTFLAIYLIGATTWT